MDAETWSRALSGALAFVLPVECAGCDAPDVALCPRCRAALRPDPRTRHLGALTVVSGLVWDGAAARVIRALKEDGRTGVARHLASALEAAARHGGFGDALVVPVPTSPAAMRRRGYRVVELLVRRAGWRPHRALRLVRRTADQRALGRDERARNADGSMRAHDVAGRRILLVDDVVTTGATLREAARAVRSGGGEVAGAVTVAATPRHRVLGDDAEAIRT